MTSSPECPARRVLILSFGARRGVAPGCRVGRAPVHCRLVIVGSRRSWRFLRWFDACLALRVVLVGGAGAAGGL